MPVTAFNGLASLQVLGHMSNGQAVSNTVHIQDTGLGSPPDVPTLLGLATEFWAWLGTAYLAVATPQYTCDQVIARQVSDPTAPVIVLEASYSVAAAGTRSVTGKLVPMGLCGVTSFRTPNASRRFRGHIFLPPAYEGNAIDGNNLDTSDAYWTNITALNVKLQAGCQPSPTWTGTHLAAWSLCIYSLAAAKVSQPSVASVQTVSARSVAHFLRSRERGGS